MTDFETIANLKQILVPKADLKLRFSYKTPEKTMAYNDKEDQAEWQAKCRCKLRELIACDADVMDRNIQVHHTTKIEFATVYSLIMHVDDTLSLPGYLLVPDEIKCETPVLAIQGHAYDVKGILGLADDYHHGFGLELCRAGFVTLVPEIRGFGTMVNLAAHDERKLIYYNWGELMAYTLVTDAFMKGYTLIGDTISDLFAWSAYLRGYVKQEKYSVAGISYGGDLALILAALDDRADKTFASGTLGSMTPIFDTCYNAPAHCIPGILKYMDRQEIAQCIAPRALAVHYGELDAPSPDNSSAAYNETALPVFSRVSEFYRNMGAGEKAQLVISLNMKHEMDNHALIEFLLDRH